MFLSYLATLLYAPPPEPMGQIGGVHGTGMTGKKAGRAVIRIRCGVHPLFPPGVKCRHPVKALDLYSRAWQAPRRSLWLELSPPPPPRLARAALSWFPSWYTSEISFPKTLLLLMAASSFAKSKWGAAGQQTKKQGREGNGRLRKTKCREEMSLCTRRECRAPPEKDDSLGKGAWRGGMSPAR